MADMVHESVAARPAPKRGVTPTRRMLQIASARMDFRIGLIGFGLLVGLAIFLPLFSSIDPIKIAYISKLLPPFPVEGWSWPHVLGTDQLGRDVLMRCLVGLRYSLFIGVTTVVLMFFIGCSLGLYAGFRGGWVDTVIMRFSELLLSIPSLYLIIALRAVFPIELPSQYVYLGIVAILAFIGWASLARVIRGLVLSIRRNEFVTAAEALGVGRFRIILRHILPNTWSFVIVAATVSVPGYILGEVVLSFLGVGVQEPSASWGNMLNQARSVRALTSFPWLLYVPGLAIFLTVMAFNFLGDGLRDALDPRRVSGGKS